MSLDYSDVSGIGKNNSDLKDGFTTSSISTDSLAMIVIWNFLAHVSRSW